MTSKMQTYLRHRSAGGLGWRSTLTQRPGPIYRLDVLGQKMVFVNTHELVNECCDDTRFKKSIEGDITVCFLLAQPGGMPSSNSVIQELRDAVHDGLFTVSHLSLPVPICTISQLEKAAGFYAPCTPVVTSLYNAKTTAVQRRGRRELGRCPPGFDVGVWPSRHQRNVR